MTKKDYELVASTLYSEGAWNSDDTPKSYFLGICYALADALATTNPRFDRAKFLAACGVSV